MSLNQVPVAPAPRNETVSKIEASEHALQAFDHETGRQLLPTTVAESGNDVKRIKTAAEISREIGDSGDSDDSEESSSGLAFWDILANPP